jgi:hypothetical protein
MASLAERVYMDLMARGKDISTARYIGKHLHTVVPCAQVYYECWLGILRLDRLFSVD